MLCWRSWGSFWSGMIFPDALCCCTWDTAAPKASQGTWCEPTRNATNIRLRCRMDMNAFWGTSSTSLILGVGSCETPSQIAWKRLLGLTCGRPSVGARLAGRPPAGHFICILIIILWQNLFQVSQILLFSYLRSVYLINGMKVEVFVYFVFSLKYSIMLHSEIKTW